MAGKSVRLRKTTDTARERSHLAGRAAVAVIGIALGAAVLAAYWPLEEPEEASEGAARSSRPADDPALGLHPPVPAGRWQPPDPLAARDVPPSPLVRRHSLIPEPEKPGDEPATPRRATASAPDALPSPAPADPAAAPRRDPAAPLPIWSDPASGGAVAASIHNRSRRHGVRLERGFEGPTGVAVSEPGDATPEIPAAASAGSEPVRGGGPLSAKAFSSAPRPFELAPVEPDRSRGRPAAADAPFDVASTASEPLEVEPPEVDQRLRALTWTPTTPVLGTPAVVSGAVAALDEPLPELGSGLLPPGLASPPVLPPAVSELHGKPMLPAQPAEIDDDIVLETDPGPGGPSESTVVTLAVNSHWTAEEASPPVGPALAGPGSPALPEAASPPAAVQQLAAGGPASPALPGPAAGLGLGLGRMSLDEEGLDPPPSAPSFPSAVPEPGTALLMAAGLAGLVLGGRRR